MTIEENLIGTMKQIYQAQNIEELLSLMSAVDIVYHSLNHATLKEDDKNFIDKCYKKNMYYAREGLASKVNDRAGQQGKSQRSIYQGLINDVINDKKEVAVLREVLHTAMNAEVQAEDVFVPIQFLADLTEKAVRIPQKDCYEKVPHVGNWYQEDDVVETLINAWKEVGVRAYAGENEGVLKQAEPEDINFEIIQEIEKRFAKEGGLQGIVAAGRGGGLIKLMPVAEVVVEAGDRAGTAQVRATGQRYIGG